MIKYYAENQDIFIDIRVKFMKIKTLFIIRIMRNAKYKVYSININNAKSAENGLKSEKKPCKCVFCVIRFRSCVRHAMKREIASDGDTPDTVC